MPGVSVRGRQDIHSWGQRQSLQQRVPRLWKPTGRVWLLFARNIQVSASGAVWRNLVARRWFKGCLGFHLHQGRAFTAWLYHKSIQLGFVQVFTCYEWSRHGVPISVERHGVPISVERHGGPISVERHGGPISVERHGGPISVERYWQ